MPSYNVKQAITMLKETNKITDENAIKDGMIITIPKIIEIKKKCNFEIIKITLLFIYNR